MKIPLHKPWIDRREVQAVVKALKEGALVGDGPFSQKLRKELENYLGGCYVLLTPSGTAALELAVLALGLGPSDEVIMPSFTFSSCANAVMLRGAKPVFVEIEQSTGNIEVEAIKQALTPQTKAVIVVHYGGWACALDRIREVLSSFHPVALIEDAAHALGARYKGQHLGTLGDCAAFSFHYTKNLSCGEGGCFVTRDQKLAERAEIIREKGTNRQAFLRGEVDKYTWVDLGSSYLLADLLAAMLLAQLEKVGQIISRRQRIAKYYLDNLADLVQKERVILPKLIDDCEPNWHVFWVRVNPKKRDLVIRKLREKGIEASFHFVPLHLSPMGQKLGYKGGDLPITEEFASSLIRLPIYPQLTEERQGCIISSLRSILLSL